jgi:hypothetical protein
MDQQSHPPVFGWLQGQNGFYISQYLKKLEDNIL